MANWYDIEPSERSEEQHRLCYEAYYHTLFQSGRGCEMLCDLNRRLLGAKTDIGKLTPELAVAQLMLQAFMDETLDLAGVGGGMALVKAMGGVAQSYRPQETENPLPEGYE